MCRNPKGQLACNTFGLVQSFEERHTLHSEDNVLNVDAELLSSLMRSSLQDGTVVQLRSPSSSKGGSFSGSSS